MRTNTLIVFEGIDGSGKSVQAKMLADRLKKQGHHVTGVHWPRYEKPIGKMINNALHGTFGDFRNLSPYFSGMPYLLDFLTTKDFLAASLKMGFVVADRYFTSTLAFHGAKLTGVARGKYIKFVEELMYEEGGMPKPHLVIYLKLTEKLAKEHMDESGKTLDQHELDTDYQRQVAEVYAKLARDKKVWRTVECKPGESPKEIHERVWNAISAS